MLARAVRVSLEGLSQVDLCNPHGDTLWMVMVSWSGWWLSR